MANNTFVRLILVLSNENVAYNLRDGPCYVLVIHNRSFKSPMSYRAGSEKDLNFVKDFCKTYRTNSLDICENYSLLRLEDKMKKSK